MDSTVSLSASQAQAAAQAINDLKEEKGDEAFSPEEQATAVASAVAARTAHEDEMHQAQEQSKLEAAPGLAPAESDESAEAEEDETDEELSALFADLEGEDDTDSSGE